MKNMSIHTYATFSLFQFETIKRQFTNTEVGFIFDNTRQENILLGQTRRSGELFKLYDNHLNEVKMTKCTGQFSITLDIYKPVQLMDKQKN